MKKYFNFFYLHSIITLLKNYKKEKGKRKKEKGKGKYKIKESKNRIKY